jgi:hypothetical protein
VLQGSSCEQLPCMEVAVDRSSSRPAVTSCHGCNMLYSIATACLKHSTSDAGNESVSAPDLCTFVHQVKCSLVIWLLEVVGGTEPVRTNL